MTTIKAGDLPQTISLPEGQALTITGSAGAAGVAYLLDPALGGTNSLRSWAIGAGALPQIGAYAGTQRFLISCSAGSVDATVQDAVLGSAIATNDSSGRMVSVAIGGGKVLVPLANPRRRAVFLGDSLTWGGCGRASGLFDGRVWYQGSVPTLTNLGGGGWIVAAMVEGTAGTAGGTLDHDGAGRVRWKYSTDAYGPYVDVSQGGFYYLSSGTTPGCGIHISVRGATAPPAAGSGAVTNAGLPGVFDYNLLGYVPWVAGALGETFSDYQGYGISGCNTADVLKFAPQALALSDVEAVFIVCGVNDIPTTAAMAAATIANLKAIIDLAAAKATRVYVADIFPWPGGTQTQQKFLALVGDAISAYCRTKSNARFCSARGRMSAPNASTMTGYATARAGAYNTDSLHLMPFGAYLAASAFVEAVKQDYQLEPIRRSAISTWDSTLLVGTLNPNPTLRGTAGSVAANNGITGTAPDGYNLLRSGSTQLLTTAFEASTDDGPDWYTMAVSGATAGDYHMLKQTVALPSGIVPGTDYVRLVCEIQIGATTGLPILQFQINGNLNLQAQYLFQSQPGRTVNTFTTQLPSLLLTGEPMKLLPGSTAFDTNFRIGADAGATGKIGLRQLRFEKCAGPAA